MKTVIFPEAQRIEIDEQPAPECGRDEVVVRVARVGLCGTDLHIHRGEYLSHFPLIPGHEFTGTVAQVGREVKGLREGDRVAVDPNLDCLHCAFCRRQQNNQCRNWQGVGITRPGAFAEWVAVPARVAYKVPETISDAAAAFIEPLSCVVHAINRLKVDVGEDVLIFGTGPMGLLLVQMLRGRGGAKVVAVDQQPDRLRLAESMGATQTVHAQGQYEEALRDIAPDGFPVVVDATGVPAVIERALGFLRPYGRYLQFGVAPNHATVSIRPYDLFKNDWTMLGTFALCYTFEQAIALLEGGGVRVEPLVSDTLPLERFQEGFDRFARGETLRVHYTP